MIDRKPKLIAAGAVLTVGLGLAMLFRRAEPPAVPLPAGGASLAATASSVTATPLVTPTPLMAMRPAAAEIDGTLASQTLVPATNVGLTAGVGLPTSDAPLLPADTAMPRPTADAALPPLGTLPLSPSESEMDGRPVYAMIGAAEAPVAAPHFQIHVVHEGDSLEHLAKRYLADAGRSLELFDLNRDVLDNPHLLPIGAELKIPVESNRSEE